MELWLYGQFFAWQAIPLNKLQKFNVSDLIFSLIQRSVSKFPLPHLSIKIKNNFNLQ
jgi:hypothetical protein